MLKTRQQIISSNSKLLLVAVGLILILLGNGFDYTILKIDIDSLVVNLGALLLVVGTLQWIFDEGIRKEIVKEISETTLGTDRIYNNGIRDCLENSRKIDEENIWKATNTLVIGVHYSNRFFDDHADVIKHRITCSKQTHIFHINEDSEAANYLRESKSGRSDIGQKTKNLLELIKTEFDSSDLIKVFKHNRVLRYSFIKTDQTVWVRFFTNSQGFSMIPAIKVETGTPLFGFFEQDITRLLEQSNELK
ncbi:hypothetical protein [Candidatus Thiodiazotropha endoloripes]|uniref:Uncharacterized protein n=1 Tax=Candidatus Thiodiazotropha endoloripes TaxID=1818881 RepID=A0A1E2UTG1_9GAMM|nr:hypothetical protein [Candidatus Thiodiazotropha endoloripes]MCG7983773.1 hypothetical protein [Candidatus Thiodiazotropha lotti]ODB98028.1 hypothetical protein A3196_15440 [Candidatus Thiodiazotropha endoloripes]